MSGVAWSRRTMESQIGAFVRQYGRGRDGRGMSTKSTLSREVAPFCRCSPRSGGFDDGAVALLGGLG